MMANLRGWPRETDMDLERGDNQVMRAKEDAWFSRKRCETGDGHLYDMECMVCGAAFGEVCRMPDKDKGSS